MARRRASFSPEGYPNTVGQHDIIDAVFKGLQLKGPPPAELEQNLQLGINAYDVTGQEFSWLKRESIGYAGTRIAAGGAGTFVFWSAQPPAGRMMVIDRLTLMNPGGAAVSVVVGMQNALPGAGGGTLFGSTRDDRNAAVGGTLGPRFNLGSNAAVTSAPFELPYLIPVNGLVEVACPWVLTGAGFLTFVNLTANSPLTWACTYRERNKLPSEV